MIIRLVKSGTNQTELVLSQEIVELCVGSGRNSDRTTSALFFGLVFIRVGPDWILGHWSLFKILGYFESKFGSFSFMSLQILDHLRWNRVGLDFVLFKFGSDWILCCLSLSRLDFKSLRL